MQRRRHSSQLAYSWSRAETSPGFHPHRFPLAISTYISMSDRTRARSAALFSIVASCPATGDSHTPVLLSVHGGNTFVDESEESRGVRTYAGPCDAYSPWRPDRRARWPP